MDTESTINIWGGTNSKNDMLSHFTRLQGFLRTSQTKYIAKKATSGEIMQYESSMYFTALERASQK